MNTRSMQHARYFHLACVSVFLFCISLARAGDLPRGDAKSAGFAADKLTRIQAALQQTVDKKQLAGGAVLIARRGKTVYTATAGLRDTDGAKPMTEDTIFRIASMTKPITSVAVMILVDEGKLQLTDPVSKFIPEFKSQRVIVASGDATPPVTAAANREVTIHDLLTHTSGITYGFNNPSLGKVYADANIIDGLSEAPGAIGDTVKRLAGFPLAHQPGAAWTYGLNTDVLGRVVEVASGKTLAEFFRERIFVPLKMTDTYFNLPSEKHARLTAVYTTNEDQSIRRVGTEPVRLGPILFSSTYSTRADNRYFSGGAGLVSTLGDYSRFLQMLLNRGELDGARILKPETVALMTRNHTGDFAVTYPGHGDRFGYGFGIVTDQARANDVSSVGSYSWGGFFHTYFWVDPQKELIGIMMSQIFPFQQLTLRDDFKRLTYAALEDRR